MIGIFIGRIIPTIIEDFMFTAGCNDFLHSVKMPYTYNDVSGMAIVLHNYANAFMNHLDNRGISYTIINGKRLEA